MEELTLLCTEQEHEDVEMRPYRRLMFAIFVRAVRDLEDLEYRQEAIRWFSGRSQSLPYAFSFQDVLDYAHIDARYLMRAREMTQYAQVKEAA